MATKYDNWKTSAPDTNGEAWTNAAEDVADNLSSDERAEMVMKLANATGALDWIAGAIEIPQRHLAAFRDLIKMADFYSEKIEDEAKVFHDPRD